MRSGRTISLSLAFLIAMPISARAQTPDIPEEASEEESGSDAAEPEEAPPEPPRAKETKKPSKPQRRTTTAPKTTPAPEAAQPETVAPTSVTKVESKATTTARLAPMPNGETGLIRVAAAESLAPKILRLSLAFDFFSVGSFIAEEDSHSRVGATLGISASPVDHFEMWLSARSQSNGNARTNPQILQSQGDLTLGVKGFYPLGSLVSVGADAQMTLLSGVGQTSFALDATQLSLRGLMSADFSKGVDRLPVRAHLNAGVLIDNSSSLLDTSTSNAERFALGISDFHRFQVGLAVEVPVKYVTPFLEYTIEFPFGYLATPGVIVKSAALRGSQAAPANATDRVCAPNDDSGCARPSVTRVIPQRITPGVRVTAIPDLTLDFAVEIGITPDVATGVLATPPYNVVMIASYAFDPFSDREMSGPPLAVPVLVPEVSEVEMKATKGAVTGIVKGQDGAMVPGAVVSFDRAPPVATSPSGMFKSLDLEPGPVAITVSKDGFENASAKADVTPGEEAEIEVKLVPAVREGTLRGRVTDDKDKPLGGIHVEIKGPTSTSLTTSDDGTFEVKAIAGQYAIEAAQEGFLKKGRDFVLKAGETMSAEMVLRKRPKQPLAEVANNMIVLRQSVHFLTGEARLAPDAAAVLDNVVDVLVANKQIKKVRIEGHTDNVGADDANLKLSRERAQAVVDYFVQQGIEAGRLTAEGLGAGRPIAPNLTRRGREQNRRVEFHIVE